MFGDKPLSEPVMVYCQLDPREHISMKLYLKFKSFHSRKCIWKCCLQKWRPSCLGLNVLITLLLLHLKYFRTKGLLNIMMSLTSIGILILKIKRSRDCLSQVWESPYLGKTVFILRRGPNQYHGILSLGSLHHQASLASLDQQHSWYWLDVDGLVQDVTPVH